jgi:hypothetical protein
VANLLLISNDDSISLLFRQLQPTAFLEENQAFKMLSVKRVCLLFFVRPAQLNKRSTAALAGNGVLRRMNSSFRAGQAATLHVSSDEILLQDIMVRRSGIICTGKCSLVIIISGLRI